MPWWLRSWLCGVLRRCAITLRKTPVLKGRVQRWLVQKKEVLAFVQARPMDGGAGALLVLLQPVAQRH